MRTAHRIRRLCARVTVSRACGSSRQCPQKLFISHTPLLLRSRRCLTLFILPFALALRLYCSPHMEMNTAILYKDHSLGDLPNYLPPQVTSPTISLRRRIRRLRIHVSKEALLVLLRRAILVKTLLPRPWGREINDAQIIVNAGFTAIHPGERSKCRPVMKLSL